MKIYPELGVHVIFSRNSFPKKTKLALKFLEGSLHYANSSSIEVSEAEGQIKEPWSYCNEATWGHDGGDIDTCPVQIILSR